MGGKSPRGRYGHRYLNEYESSHGLRLSSTSDSTRSSASISIRKFQLIFGPEIYKEGIVLPNFLQSPEQIILRFHLTANPDHRSTKLKAIMQFSTIHAVFAVMLSASISGVAADCLSTDGNWYPFGTYTCNHGNEIVSSRYSQCAIFVANMIWGCRINVLYPEAGV